MTRWPRSPGFRCMPVSLPRPINARSWNGCAVTLPYMDVGYLDA